MTLPITIGTGRLLLLAVSAAALFAVCTGLRNGHMAARRGRKIRKGRAPVAFWLAWITCLLVGLGALAYAVVGFLSG